MTAAPNVEFVGGGRPNAFQARAAERIADVLAAHAIPVPRFRFERGQVSYFRAVFDHGDEHGIELYRDTLVMDREDGKRRFEPYLRAEFRDDEALIEGFVTRLDRYLFGGGWAGPEEGATLARWRRRVRRWLGR